MPLSDYVQARIDGIRGFLAEPDAVVLELRSAPDQRAVVGKLLVGLAGEGEYVWAAVDQRFADAAGYCVTIATAIATAVADAAKEFAQAEVAFAPPPTFDPQAISRRTTEQALVEYVEEVAVGLEPFLHGVVVACSIDDESAGAIEMLAMLGRIAEASEGGRFKLVLVVDANRAMVRDVAIAPARVTVLRGDDPAVARTLRHAAFDPLPRVLVYDAPRRGQTWMPLALVEAGVANRALVVRVDDVRFWGPIHFYARAAEIVTKAVNERAKTTDKAKPAAGLLAELATPRGRHGAEIVFVQWLVRLQRELLGPQTELVVVLCPSLAPEVPAGEHAAFAESLQRLARADFCSRVKFCAVAPGLATIAREQRAGVMRFDAFRIDGKVIEKGLVHKLAQPELPQLERLRCLSALAAYRMHNGDPEGGIETSVEALELAHTTNDPIEIASAWYGTGGALYHCAAFDKSIDAYAQCVDLAVTHDNTVLAASGMTGLGHCDFMLRQYDRAIERYAVAARYYGNLGHALAEAYVRTWIAESHAAAARDTDAIVEFDRALARVDSVHETFGDAASTSRADILQRKARVFDKLGMQSDRRRDLDAARKLGATAAPSMEP